MPFRRPALERAAASRRQIRSEPRRASATDVFPRFLAGGYTLLGQHDNALRWLTTAVERGFINYPFLNAHDPLLADLRSRPAFTTLMDDVRRRWNAFPA